MEDKMAKKPVVKKSIDIPEDLFESIMTYAHKEKIYKFSPAVLKLLGKALESDNG